MSFTAVIGTIVQFVVDISISIPKTPPLPQKKIRSHDKRHLVCQFDVSCYRKNPLHRAEQSHPGDSDYEDSKQSNDIDNNDSDKPECPFGKSSCRQNAQHKRDFKH